MGYSIDNFIKITRSTDGSFSPDGKKILYHNNQSGSFQAYLTSSTNPSIHQLLGPFPEPVEGATYNPVTEKILFGLSKGGDERHHLHILDLTTKKIQKITPDTDEHIRGYVWSHDGKKITYASNARNGVDFDAYIYDCETNTHTRVFEQGGHAIPKRLSPKNTYLPVKRSISNAREELFLVHMNTKKIEPIITPIEPTTFGTPQWMPDEKSFFFTSNRNGDFEGVFHYELSTQKVTPVWNPPHDVDAAKISPNGEKIALLTNEEGFSRLTVRRTSDFQLIWEPKDAFAMSTNTRWSNDSRQLLFSAESSVKPEELWLWDETTNTLKLVAESQCDVPRETFVQPTLIHYPSFDARTIPAFIYRPPSTSEKRPVIIIIHGGPEGQSRPDFAPLIQFFVQEGYAVILPNVRGSTGYGKIYSTLDDVYKRMDSVKDLAALHKYIQKQPDFDEQNVALFGGSYGGYMVLAGLCFFPECWAAGIDIVGISSLVTMLQNTSSWRKALREQEYGSLEKDREFLESVSPINFVQNIRAPLFIIHGANDPRVPLSEAYAIETKLHEKGLPVELLVYPDEGHGLSKRANRLEAYTKATQFLDKYLKK